MILGLGLGIETVGEIANMAPHTQWGREHRNSLQAEASTGSLERK